MVNWRLTPRCFSSHLAVVAATFLLAAPLAPAQEQPPPWLLCGPAPVTSNYTENTTYPANINRLAATLPTNTSSSPVLYATDNVGSVPDVVFGLALCRGDANTSACERCVATAFRTRSAQQGCPLFRDVMIFYDLCQLRFSNRNFLRDDDYLVNTFYLQGSRVVMSSAATEAFDAAVRRLVSATADYAAGNPSRRFGTGEMDFGDKSNPKIYALSQCTPDRTEDVCRSCLSTVTGQLAAYFNGSNGGGVFGVWCSFRYEVYPFFSGRSLLQLPATVPTPPGPPPDKSKNKTGLVLAIMMPSLCAVLAITIICFWRRSSAAQTFPPYSNSPDDIQGADMLLLDLSTLQTATDDFNESKMIGRGGFGIVYKGILPEGQEIAVKRLCQSSRQGIGELKSELVLVAKLHHKNLVRLLGVCLQEQEKILVYEYLPNKSLDTILFDSGRNREFDWLEVQDHQWNC